MHATSEFHLPTCCSSLPPAVALVYNAERINSLAGRHWQQFARQNYFDGNGVFAGVLLGAPLLTIMFVILVGCASGAAHCSLLTLAACASTDCVMYSCNVYQHAAGLNTARLDWCRLC